MADKNEKFEELDQESEVTVEKDDFTDEMNDETDTGNDQITGDNPFAILEAQVAEKERLAKDYLDKLQRTMAEYDNFRKRTVKEKSAMYDNGAKEVLEKILPVIDNFQRALSSVKEEERETSLAQGVEMIFKQLTGAFKDLGVIEIEAKGKEFDPNLHHAVAHEENDAVGENEVVDVLQPGYMYKDKVLRCSMVKVAN